MNHQEAIGAANEVMDAGAWDWEMRRCPHHFVKMEDVARAYLEARAESFYKPIEGNTRFDVWNEGWNSAMMKLLADCGGADV